MDQIELWVDGAAQPNPGRGGCAALLIQDGIIKRRLVSSYFLTTNNRMELRAILLGMGAITSPATITVYSDSKYAVRGLRSGGYKHRLERGLDVANPDL